MARRRLIEDIDLIFPNPGHGAEPIERRIVRARITCFCGVDEAGRGPLAGPVVAAAINFRDHPVLWCARDSKQIGEHQREQLAGDLLRNFDVGIGIADEHEIAQLNILQASLRAMCRAMDALKSAPELALVDGNQPIPHPTRSIPVIHGDARIHLISAASIVAKVERDRLMRELDLQYPAYGFARHFGYPTAEHRAKLAALGPCPIHRRTFRGVREHFDAVA